MTSARAAAGLGRACAVAVLVAVGLLGATTATAAPPDGAIEVSVDGRTWSADLAADLFDPAVVWVPGDTATASLLMRSRACPAASGRAEVTLGPRDPVLVAAFAVRTRVVGATGEGDWTPGTTSATFAVGAEPSRLDVEVTFDPASGNATQDRVVAPVVVTVTAECDAEPRADAGSRADAEPRAAGSGGFLPRTGVEVARTLGAGALLVVAGGWLVLAARRRRDAHA